VPGSDLNVLGEDGQQTADRSNVETPPIQMLLRTCALIAIVIGGWLTLTAWFAVIAPPGLMNLVPVAVLASAAWAVMLWLGSRPTARCSAQEGALYPCG